MLYFLLHDLLTTSQIKDDDSTEEKNPLVTN